MLSGSAVLIATLPVSRENGHRSHVKVALDKTLRIEVADNRRGGATTTAGRGLRGIADRVALAGGTLKIDSPSGGPTRILAALSYTG